MIDVLLALLPVLIIVLFGGIFATWIHIINRPDKYIEKMANRFSWIVFAIYLFWMVLLSVHQKQLPFICIGQLTALIGFLVWSAHLYVQSRIKQGILVVFPVLSAIILILFSIILGARPENMPEIFSGPWVAFHIMFSMAGVVLLLSTGVYGTGYLILHRQIKLRRFGTLYSFMPSLAELNKLQSLTLKSGWLLLTVSIITGTLWMLMMSDFYMALRGHLGIALVIWFLISLMTAAFRFNWFSSRKLSALTMILSTIMVVLIIMSMFITYLGGAV